MNTSFVPSLQHLTCSRTVVSLLQHLEVHKDFREKKYVEIKCQVTETISRLTPYTRLREKLEKFIDPLIGEIEDWLKIFEYNWYGYDRIYSAILESLPQCWLSDGTIDRHMSMKSLVKNKDLRPVNRFIFACTYCFFDDALDIWKILFKIEKAYVRHKSTPIVMHWAEWLESSSNKDWEFFAAWTLGTPLWNTNVYILKHALGTLSPAERSQYMFKALIGKEVPTDVMRYCISMMTKDERKHIFRESPAEVFRCFSSWPLRSIFYDIVDNLRPYLTIATFRNIFEMNFRRIRNMDRGCGQLIEMLQDFWTQSPRHLKNALKGDPRFFKPLQFLLNCDVSKEFDRLRFLDSFLMDLPDTLPRPQLLPPHRRRTGARRRYRNML